MSLKFRDYFITLPDGESHKLHLSENDKGEISFGGSVPHRSTITVENLKAMCGSCDGCEFSDWDAGMSDECFDCIRNPLYCIDNFTLKES